MPRTREFLTNMPVVRTALVARFAAFLHSTPFANIDSIRAIGLEPRVDMRAPTDIMEVVGTSAILCLHPVGSQLIPGGTKSGSLMTLAIRNEDMPARLGLDWSYSYEQVRGRMELYREMPIGELTCRIADQWGSVVSYDVILAPILRVRCRDSVENPRDWPLLSMVTNEQIIQHD
jgi:hypothetical protein